jgi:hypothetical protein
MDEVTLPMESMAYVKQTIIQFNRAVEDRIGYFLQRLKMIRPKPSESTIFSVGSFIPSDLSSASASELAKTIIEAQFAQSQPSLRSIANSEAQHTNSRTSAECKETAATLPTTASVTLEQNSCLKAFDFCSKTPVQESTKSPASPTPSLNEMETGGPYFLTCGRETTISISKGESVRFQVPGLQFEFTYGDSPTKPSFGNREFTILHLEWLSSQNVDRSAEHIDLEAPALKCEVSCSGIFEKNGVILYGKGQAVLLRVEALIDKKRSKLPLLL